MRSFSTDTGHHRMAAASVQESARKAAGEPRPLYEIADEVFRLWRDKKGHPAIYFGAVPYLRAMQAMQRIADNYGADTGRSVVLYFLGNATTWRGEDARRVKAELQAMLKATPFRRSPTL